jgi:hypothetical protein
MICPKSVANTLGAWLQRELEEGPLTAAHSQASDEAR